MKKTLIITLLNLISFAALAGNCTVSGMAEQYKGQRLVLKTYTDEIVFTEKELASAVVDSTGFVCFEFNIATAASCFLELGAYQAILFVEPKKTYYVGSFPFKPVTKAQTLDPYFRPDKILLSVKEPDEGELNYQIRKFESVFNHYYVNAAMNTTLDFIRTTVTELEAQFPQTGNVFFEDYKNYKYALLINLNERNSPKLAISSYFSKLPVAYENISFWEAFNVTFDNLFQVIYPKAGQETLDKALEEGNFTAVNDLLDSVYGITGTKLRELVVLKGLYDASFSEKRDKAQILSLLKNWKQHITCPQNILISESIINELTQIIALSKPFDFTLPDEKGKLHQLSGYEGKYIYLNFCSTDIILSKKDFGILARYAATYKKDLDVINVFTGGNQESMNAFTARLKDKQMINLFGGNDRELLEKYRVIKIPAYFLIDKNGNFLLAPAPTPDEGFEHVFEEMLWKEKMKNQKAPKIDIPGF